MRMLLKLSSTLAANEVFPQGATAEHSIGSEALQPEATLQLRWDGQRAFGVFDLADQSEIPVIMGPFSARTSSSR
jgi:hypothetical protein